MSKMQQRKVIENMNCHRCNKEFYSKRPAQKYCSFDCAFPKTEIDCKKCGKTFRVKPKYLGIKKFCSRECRKTNYKANCLHCEKEFITVPAENRKYCNKLCASSDKRNKTVINCTTCGNSLALIQSRIKVNAKYCSQQCFHDRFWKDGKRVCKGCGKFCTKKQFAATKENRIGLKTRCIPCQKKYHADARRRLHFNLTPEKHEDMLKRQNNKCAICGSSKGKKSFAVDHCHKTGMVRGLLCGSCNTGLGLFKDSPQNLENAIEYLLSCQTNTFVDKNQRGDNLRFPLLLK